MASEVIYLFNQQDGLDLNHELDMIRERVSLCRLEAGLGVSACL